MELASPKVYIVGIDPVFPVFFKSNLLRNGCEIGAMAASDSEIAVALLTKETRLVLADADLSGAKTGIGGAYYISQSLDILLVIPSVWNDLSVCDGPIANCQIDVFMKSYLSNNSGAIVVGSGLSAAGNPCGDEVTASREGGDKSVCGMLRGKIHSCCGIIPGWK